MAGKVIGVRPGDGACYLMELSNPHSPKMIETQTPSAKISAYSSARLASGRSSGPGITMTQVTYDYENSLK